MRTLALAATLLATPAIACETALVLAIDVSGSVDQQEYRLQMDGLAAALKDPTVIDALVAAQARISVLQWSGSSRQQIIVPWIATVSEAEVDRLAREVEAAPRAFRHYSTAIGEALSTSAAMLGEIAGVCDRQVIDVSGDGTNNEGVEVTRMRDALIRGGVVINGLAIEMSEPDLTIYYQRNVIGGTGSFVMTARTFQDYPEAIRRKLLRELTDKVVEAPKATRIE